MLISQENEKNAEKGFLLIQGDLWWDVAFSDLKTMNTGSIRFKGKYGTIELYGNIIALSYASDKEKEGMIHDYHLSSSHKRK